MSKGQIPMGVLDALPKPEKASQTTNEMKKAPGPVRNAWVEAFLKESGDSCRPEPRNGKAGHATVHTATEVLTRTNGASERPRAQTTRLRGPRFLRGPPPPRRGTVLEEFV